MTKWTNAAMISALVLTSSTMSAQGSSERLVALSARLDVRALSYSTRNQYDTVVIYALGQDPLELEVSVGNNTTSILQLGTSERAWLSDLVVRVFRRDGVPVGIGITRRTTASAPDAGGVSVAPMHSHSVRFALTPQDISSFSPGRYEVEVSLNATALHAPAVGLANILVRRILFEIRQPKTDAELVDAYLQRGYEHLRAGDAKSARDDAQRALRINPVSLPALTDVGAAWLLAGNCEQAVAAYRQALPLITGGADNELKISETGRHEWARNLRAKIASRCGAR